MNTADLQSRHNLNINERRFEEARQQRGHITTVPVRMPRLYISFGRVVSGLKRIASNGVRATRTA